MGPEVGNMDVEFPAADYQHLVGKRLVSAEQTTEGDEGFKLVFEDGSTLEFAFSGCEGTVYTYNAKDGSHTLTGDV
jgi:hypothetical protein